MLEAAEQMLIIKTLDGNAMLNVSEWTQEWYVVAEISIDNGSSYTSITEHWVTPDDAVAEYFHRITHLEADETLVTHSFCANQRKFRWNGAAFQQLP